MKIAQLVQDGQSQMVRLPEEYRLAGSSVHINRLGSCLILIPENDPWKPVFEAARRFTPDFMSTRERL